MVRGINGQQREEAEAMEQGHALNVLSQVRELAFDLNKEGKVTVAAMREILRSTALAELAVEDDSGHVFMSREEIMDRASENIAERWAQGW